MNSDDLGLFARVAKMGSISRVAMELGANQSTISRRIGVLETELGVRLFRRSGRGVWLTEQGEQLLAYAATVTRTLEEAEQTLRSSSSSGPARLCIAAQPTIARIMFGVLGHAIKARYPKAQVRFVEGLASHIQGWLQDGEVDFALMYLPESRSALQFDILMTEGVCLITPADFPLKGEAVNVRALENIPLILPSGNNGLRVLVETLASRHGFVPKIAFECDGSISITKRLVLAKCGCTVLPSAAVVEEVAAGRLKCFRLSNPAVERDVALVWPKNRVMPAGLWEVTSIVRQVAVDLVRRGTWRDTRLSAALAPLKPGDPLAS
jgi:DNA-binding transcriptional LysR family regulator